MRLISQDGMIDVPYNLSALSLGGFGDEKQIFIRSKLLDEKPCIFANYSTKEKAIKAMEMLRNASMGVMVVSKETSDILVDSISKAIRNGFVQPIPLQEPQIECKYFQFPKDEEIEV